MTTYFKMINLLLSHISPVPRRCLNNIGPIQCTFMQAVAHGLARIRKDSKQYHHMPRTQWAIWSI